MIYGLLVHTVHKLNNKTIVPIFPPQALKNFYHHAVSIFVVILVELTNTVFVNSTNISTNIETAVLFALLPFFAQNLRDRRLFTFVV